MILKKNFLSKSECGFLIENVEQFQLWKSGMSAQTSKSPESIMAKVTNLVQPSKPTFAIQKYEVGEKLCSHRDSLKHTLRTHSLVYYY